MEDEGQEVEEERKGRGINVVEDARCKGGGDGKTAMWRKESEGGGVERWVETKFVEIYRKEF